jgi:valine dehydrogenase (NAD+)
VGTNQADMDLIGSVTPYVTGRSVSLGGSGDPSPATAWGVRCALDAVAERLWGAADLAGRHVVVSGVGKVGSALVDHLIDAGCRVTVADVAEAAVLAVRRRHPAVEVVDPADAHAVACDVFSPCAMGAVLSGATIAQLRCAAVCGSANNQLQTPADGARLADHGVLYAPDYVVNAGGVINIAEERRRSGATYDRDKHHAAARPGTGRCRWDHPGRGGRSSGRGAAGRCQPCDRGAFRDHLSRGEPAATDGPHPARPHRG